jgi:RNA polymerase sigma-70 factor (ECF subfamily)
MSELDRLKQSGENLAELFDEYRERLERIVEFRMDPRMRSRFDPSDVLQDAFLEVSRRLPEYLAAPEVSFFVWLRQKTLQTLIDRQRGEFRQKRNPEVEVRVAQIPDPTGTSISMARFLIDDLTSPSQVLVQEEERARLRQALESMGETDREILALRHFEHLSNQQVAEALRISPTAASNRYVRAAARLGEILREVQSRIHKRPENHDD